MFEARRTLKMLAIAGLFACGATAARAEWNQNGNLVGLGTGADQSWDAGMATMAMVPDGAGGAILFWSNYYNTLFAQRITASGEIASGWPAGGVDVSPLGATPCFPMAVSDSAGGAFVLFYRANSTGQIRLQRVTSEGMLAYHPSGLLLDIEVGSYALGEDGSGGVFVAWTDNTQLFVSHYNNVLGLVPGWSPGGNPLCPQAVGPAEPSIVSDGSGGAIVAWSDRREYPSRGIYATRMTGDGLIAPGWSINGNVASLAPGDRYDQDAVSDGAGGILAVWPDYRSPATNADLYAQRLTGDGNRPAGWAGSGNPVTVDVGYQQEPRIVADGSGGAVMVWRDSRNGGYDVYAQRLLSNGVVASGWAAGGSPVCTSSLPQTQPVLIPDGTGGAFFAWNDPRNGNADIYAVRFDGAGGRPGSWSENGTAICTAAGNQGPVALCADGAGGIIAAWRDFRRGVSVSDIYAMRYDADGTPPVLPPLSVAPGEGRLLAIRRVVPNPSRGPCVVSFRLADERPARLEWVDVSGRLILARELSELGAGEHSLRIDTEGLPAGIYFVRLLQGERIAGTRAALIR